VSSEIHDFSRLHALFATPTLLPATIPTSEKISRRIRYLVNKTAELQWHAACEAILIEYETGVAKQDAKEKGYAVQKPGTGCSFIGAKVEP
jgi:hypothetical protein